MKFEFKAGSHVLWTLGGGKIGLFNFLPNETMMTLITYVLIPGSKEEKED